MIIEFFGTPGSGKTPLLHELCTLMPGARIAVETSRQGIFFGALRFAIRHPISFCVWMAELFFHAHGLFRYKLGLLLRSMAARARAEALANSGPVFIDEGLLQRMLSIFDTPLSQNHMRFLLRMTPLPNLAVVMTGGDFGRFTAADNRFNSPRVSDGPEKLQEWIRVVRTNVETAGELFPDSMHVIACTRGEPDADAVAVLSKITQHKGGSRK